MIRSWIEAMRLRTLPVSVAGVIAGTACAIILDSFKAVPAIACLLFAILAQIAANFGNEYYDYKNGIDRKGRLVPVQEVCREHLYLLLRSQVLMNSIHNVIRYRVQLHL